LKTEDPLAIRTFCDQDIDIGGVDVAALACKYFEAIFF
jgi:hypothetical protein